MKIIFLILFSIIRFISFAQFNQDSVTNKSKFIYDSLNSDLFKSMKRLGQIEQSQNYIEIRLLIFHSLGGTEQRILAYNKEGWHAMRVVALDLLWNHDRKPILVTQSKLIPKKQITEIITELDNIDLLHLKSSNELNTPTSIDDGVRYAVDYKTGNEFRHIGFNNPSDFAKMYPDQEEYKKYVKLVNIFCDQFTRE